MSQSLLQQAADYLTRDIMNMPHKCPDDCMTPTERMGYSAGHRDARHAAVELVNAAFAAIQQQPEPVAVRYRPNGNGRWRYLNYPFTKGWTFPEGLGTPEPLYAAPPPALQQQEVPPSEHGRLTPHQLWRERAIWLLDALTDATRELRENGELDAVLAHLDKHPSLASSPSTTRQQEVGNTLGVLATAEAERLKAMADEFRSAIPTPDGAVLAAMIEQGVTVLESHIRYAYGVQEGGHAQR